MFQYNAASGGITPAEYVELETALRAFARYMYLDDTQIPEMVLEFVEYKAVLVHKDKVNGFTRPSVVLESGDCYSPYVASYLERLGILDRL